MKKRILTTKHSISESNTGKINLLNVFIDEYRSVAQQIVDNIWDNGYTYEINGETFEFNVSKNQLDVPTFIDYKRFKVDTVLTARALSSLVTQLSGVLSASTEKQRKRLYMLSLQKDEGVSRSKRKQLIKKIKQNVPQKPNCSKLNPELSSKCVEYFETTGYFNGVIKLSSIFKSREKIILPVKHTSRSRKMISDGGQLLKSFLIRKNGIDFRWEFPVVKQKKEGKIIGIDQGIKSVITCSDNQHIQNTDAHGHSLESIMTKMSRKKKGSKAFKRCQDQRKNFINWSVNQLNLSEVKEVRLERIWNIGYKNPSTRWLRHWTNTIIRDKLISVCETNGVHLIEQDSTYRSQRCSSCGLVRKSNRKGKIYLCKNCGNTIDADYNASINHEVDIPEVPYNLRKMNLNRSGFFWKENGFFDLSGTSLESVPLVEDKL